MSAPLVIVPDREVVTDSSLVRTALHSRLEELEEFYSTLLAEEGDELLQRLLVAAPRGGEAMLQVLEEVLLRRPTEELLGEHRGVGQ